MTSEAQPLPQQGHICIHEDKITRHDEQIKHQIQTHQELKKNMARFEEKLDKVLQEIHEQKIESNKDDKNLELRLKAIETELTLTKEIADSNRKDTNLKLMIITIVFAALTFYFNFLHHIG